MTPPEQREQTEYYLANERKQISNSAEYLGIEET